MASSSIGFSVGAIDRASGAFEQVADAVDGLRRELRTLDKVTASPTVDVDTGKAEKKVGAFAVELQRRIKAAVDSLPDIDIDADASDADREIARVRRDLASLADQRVGIDIDAAQARARVQELHADLARLGADSADPQVRVDTAAAAAQLAAFEKHIDRVDGRTISVDADVDAANRKVQILDKSFGAATIRAAALARAMSTIALPAAIVAATPYIASLGASAVQAAGSLWLLPAAATAGGVAFAALKVGMSGFGDAMKELDDPEKFAEAIAKLSPAARAAATAVRGLVPAWTAMQQVVQQKLFAGVAGSIRELAGSYLPLLRAGLGGAASELNRFVLGFAAFAGAPQTLADVPVLFNNVNASLRVLAPVVNNLLGTFRDIAVVGSAFLPQLAQGAVNATQRFQTFVHTARETGQLHRWIQTALDTMAQLGRIVGNVGSILGSVFAAGAASGESFLSVLERVTGSAAAALRTPEGAAALTGFFVQIREVVGIFVEKLITVWPAISAAASAFAALLSAAAPVANVLLSLVVSALVPMLNAIGWLAPVLGPLAVGFIAVNTAVGAATAIMSGWGAVVKTAGVVSSVFSALIHPIATATKLWAGAQAALNVVMAMNPIGLVVIAIAALVAGLVLAWNHSETFRNVVTGAWNAILAGVRAAVAWFQGPFMAFWAGLGSFFANLWSSITGFFTSAWDGLVSSTSTAFTTVVGFVAALPGRILSFFTSLGASIASGAAAAWAWLVTATSNAIDAALEFVVTLPNRIAFTLGFLAATLYRAAVDGWAAFTTGLENAWVSTIAFFVSLPSRITSFLTGLGAAIYTWAVTSWDQFTSGLISAWAATVAWFAALPTRIGAFLTGLGAALYTWAVAAWTQFTTGIATAWAATVVWFAALPARITAFLVGLGATLYTWAVTAWTGFTDGLSAAWTATVVWFATLPARIGAFFVNAGTWLMQTGLDIVAGLYVGVAQAWNGLLSWIGGLILSFIDGVKAGFGVASPSTIFAEIGGFLIQGLIQGIQTAAAFLWSVITTVASGVVTLFITGIQTLAALWAAVWNGIVFVFQTVWATIQSVALTVWGWIQSYFAASLAAYQALWSTVWNGIFTVFTTVWNFIRGVAVTVWGAIVAFFTGAFAAYTAFFAGVWNGILALFTGVWNRLWATVQYYWAMIRAYYNLALQAFSFYWTQIWNSVLAFFTGLWARLWATVQYYWAMINAYYNLALQAFSFYWTQVWNAILAFFTGLWGRIWTTVRYYWDLIKYYYNGALETFKIFWSDTWNSIVGTFDRIWSTISGIATRVWDNVKSAFKTGVNAVIDVINIFADAINKVAGLLGFNIDLRIPRLAEGGPISGASAGRAGTALAAARAEGGPIALAGGGNTRFRRGGRLPYTGKNRDTIPAMAGSQPYALMGEEYVVRRSSTRAIGSAGMAAINNADNRPVDIVPRSRMALYRDGGAIGLASGGELAAAAQRGVPGTRVTSTYRPGAAGLHGSNQAADLAGPRSMDTAFMHRINKWIADNHGAATTQLIYTPGINLLNGRPHSYNAATRADHQDHVHWGMTGPLAGGQGGVFSSIITFLLDQAKNLLNPLRDRLIPIRDNQGESFGKRAMAGGGLKMIDWLFEKAAALDAATSAMGPAGPGSGPVVDQVRAVANRYGWGSGPQWDALSRLIQKESSWNPNAQNPTSTAYGLFQFLNSTWATVGGRKTSNPGEQAEYGLRYIQGKYRDPVGALRFHNANNWYDQGGLANGRGIMMKDVLTPERVLSGQQTKAFEQLVAGLTAGRPQSIVANGAMVAQLAASQHTRRGTGLVAAGDGGVTVHIGSVTTPPGTTASGLAGAVTREMRVAKHGGRYRR